MKRMSFMVCCVVLLSGCKSASIEYRPHYLLSESSVSIEVNSQENFDSFAYLKSGRRALNEGEEAAFHIKGEVDVKTMGTYQVKYNKNLTLKVDVVDTTAPILSIGDLYITKGTPITWDDAMYQKLDVQMSDNHTSMEELRKTLVCEVFDTSQISVKEVACRVHDESGNIGSSVLHAHIQEPQKSHGTQAIRNASTPSSAQVLFPTISPGDAALNQQVVNLVNAKRAAAGIAPVVMASGNLQGIVALRADEMLQSYSHTRPNGSMWYTIFDEYAIRYEYAGENLAKGQQTPEEVVNDWMNSQKHRENILNPNFTQLAVDVAGNSSSRVWVQLFIGY